MAVAPATGQTPAHTGLARWAVGTAVVAAVMVALALAGLGGGGAGMMASFAAFAMAVVAKVRHERWPLLWLPLLLFPTLIVSAPFWV